jgi:hypothetical protein
MATEAAGRPGNVRSWIAAVAGNGILQRMQTADQQQAQAVARGYLLICVFYIHAMIGVTIYMGSHAWYSLLQLKLLAPNISAFFFLSGMAAPNLGRKGPGAAVRASLVLLLLAIISHLMVYAILLAGQRYHTPWDIFKALARPLVYGIGYASYVSWFFVVLAVARLLAYVFVRSKLIFAVVVALLVAAVWTSQRLGLPDNIYEWRNWPTATLFFLLGMHMPHGSRIPNWLSAVSLVLALGVAAINRTDIFVLGPCVTCDLRFVPQPMVGQYGSIFLYVPQQIAFFVFLVWAAQRSANMMIGKVGFYFGRASIPILLLHGCVLVTLYPVMLNGLPTYENWFLFVAVFSSVVVIHALLYALLSGPLDWLQIKVFHLSHFSLTNWRKYRPRRRSEA